MMQNVLQKRCSDHASASSNPRRSDAAARSGGFACKGGRIVRVHKVAKGTTRPPIGNGREYVFDPRSVDPAGRVMFAHRALLGAGFFIGPELPIREVRKCRLRFAHPGWGSGYRL